MLGRSKREIRRSLSELRQILTNLTDDDPDGVEGQAPLVKYVHDVVDRLIERGVTDVRIATGPVAGAHVVEYV